MTLCFALQSFTLLLWDIIEEGGTRDRWGQINIHIMATGAKSWKCKSFAKTTKQPTYESCCTSEGRTDSLNRLWAGDNHWMQAFSNSKSLPSKSRSVFTRRNINWMTQCLTHKNYQAQTLYNVHVEPWVQLCLLRTELPFQFSCWNFSCSSIICKMQCI